MSARRFLTVALAATTLACDGGDSVTGPSSPPTGYAGQWNGTTSQGAPVTVVVSADQKVTSITVAYRFNGCSGTKTFSNLSLTIATAPTPPGNPQPPGPFTGNPGFGYVSGDPDAGNFTQLMGAFTSNSAATGMVLFSEFDGCGSSIALWDAARR